ncbi:MAG: hypothetical protein LUE88_01460 [Clostridiales bacterium]|nr:hypothetical protein [Clostridiales bacterium]
MKKRLIIVLTAAVIALSMTACGSSDDEEQTDAGQETSTADDSSADTIASTDITKISHDEIASLADYEFYAANSSSADITALYVAVSGGGDWGNSLITSPIQDGTKVKITMESLDSDATYDVCVVDSNSNTTEYYIFNMKSTVQITFYADAQCDVSTI